MKKLILLSILSLSIHSFSQNQTSFSIEPGIGYSEPLTENTIVGNDNIVAFNNFNFGIRFMINHEFGIKTSFNYDTFENGKMGSTQSRISLEGFYNIDNLIDLSYISNQSVVIFSHIGFGGSFNTSKLDAINKPGTERQINLTFGLSPRFRLTDSISLFTDLTYVTNFKQHVYYSGEAVPNATNSGVIGSHLTFSLGLAIEVGSSDNSNDFN